MTLPELCIRRPVMTTLLMAAFIIFAIYRIFTTVYIGNINKHLQEARLERPLADDPFPRVQRFDL